MIYLDTHVLVRLYLGEPNKLGTAARKAIEEQDLMVSPAAILELEYLHEIGRLRPTAWKVISALGDDAEVRRQERDEAGGQERRYSRPEERHRLRQHVRLRT